MSEVMLAFGGSRAIQADTIGDIHAAFVELYRFSIDVGDCLEEPIRLNVRLHILLYAPLPRLRSAVIIL